MYKKNKYLLIVITMLMSIFLNACTEMDNSIEKKTSSVTFVTNYSETTEDIAENIDEQITTELEIITEEQITTELQTTTEELTSIETTTERQTTTEKIIEPQEETTSIVYEYMVWISETGSKYHRVNDCGRMNPNKAYQMSKEDAEREGYEPCKKCYK